MTDVVIIGGGASGLCAAVYLKQNNPALSVTIIERQNRVGKKLATTGNGRCNITNKIIDLSRYHGKNVQFCRYALEKYDIHKTERFFASIGVPFVFENDKAYPASLQASSVVDCLRFACDALGVVTLTDTKVTDIIPLKSTFKLHTDKSVIAAKNVIVATGLLSGGDKLGCDGMMLNLLKSKGYKTVPTTPAIVQVKTVTDVVKALKGVKINAKVTLKIKGATIKSDYGETLFCDYGLSGPPILQLSREIPRSKTACELVVDTMPHTDFSQLFETLRQRASLLKQRTLDEFFTGMLNKRLGQVVLKLAGCKLSDTVSTLTTPTLKKITSLLKSLTFETTGTAGFAASQVTAGGICTEMLDSKTMMSKLHPGMYIIGELADIDGDCGGFNLQWAWSSAFCAADNIIR